MADICRRLSHISYFGFHICWGNGGIFKVIYFNLFNKIITSPYCQTSYRPQVMHISSFNIFKIQNVHNWNIAFLKSNFEQKSSIVRFHICRNVFITKQQVLIYYLVNSLRYQYFSIRHLFSTQNDKNVLLFLIKVEFHIENISINKMSPLEDINNQYIDYQVHEWLTT